MTRTQFIILTALFLQVLAGQGKKYVINGEVAYANGNLISDAVVMLLDTTDKMILKTRSSKKFLKKYGGGKFKFEDVTEGNYFITVDLGTRIGIKKFIQIVDKDIDLGTIYNVVEFPKYEIGDYPVPNLIQIRPISTIPIPSDSINIRHIIVDLNGNANTIIVDSILRDSVYYTDFDILKKHVIDLDKVYFIYNDYGIFIHQSRSMKDRMKELQNRDGFMVFHSGDTLQFDNIFFEPVKNNPEVGTFHKADTTTAPRYHALKDIYYVKTGKSFLENSVRKGFYFGLISVLSGDYGTIITVVPVVTLGKVGYDWYKDIRSNYFIPKNENDPFPRNMFVFSLSEWLWNKSQPIIKPIMNSRVIKWWKGRKLRKVQKEAAKRKSDSG
ncbi:MAG: carboxypeptidase-like regulatory domain-containing protein [Candidatus Marinimicrobia bacterium]|nr:carboxypeptidase-like regulatory domain-containing protein [Candidatus Neomarinimicrobiota bacterium]